MLEVMYTTWMVGFQRVHGIETSFEYHKRVYKAIAAHQSQEAYDAMKRIIWKMAFEKLNWTVPLQDTDTPQKRIWSLASF